jgi:protein phosphatase
MVAVNGIGRVPDDAIVVLIGASGSGKSTWARARFEPDVILSSDEYRVAVAGDAADQTATADAFKVLHLIARARARRGLLTVVDATNLTTGARTNVRHIANDTGRPVVAVVFDISLDRCLAQNMARPDRHVPDDVVRKHCSQLTDARPRLPSEGYMAIHFVEDAELTPA